MGVDPLDGRHRVRYDGEALTWVEVAPALTTTNHRIAPDTTTHIDIGDGLMVCTTVCLSTPLAP